MYAPTMIGPSLDLRHGRSRPPSPSKAIVVQKYGGTLLRSPEGRNGVLEQIRRTRAGGHPVVVVASAMGREGEAYATDTLLRLANDIGPRIDPRTQDLLLSCGEVISTALLAHLLAHEGYQAVALTGREAGIVTDDHFGDAHILSMQPLRVLRALKDRQIPVVAGFQGRTATGDVTTLGRGGSDISAVALAAALGAEVEIFKDVESILTADPRLVPNARTVSRMTYADAALAGWLGARVLHPRAAELGQAHGVPLAVRPVLGDAASGTTFVPNRVRCAASILVVHTPDVASDTPSQGPCARVSLVGSGLRLVVEARRRAAKALRAAGVHILAFEGSAPGTVMSWLVPPGSMEAAARTLHHAFVEELPVPTVEVAPALQSKTFTRDLLAGARTLHMDGSEARPARVR
jgi:aspartate kinase